jgi:hypothetical protein
MVVEAPDEPVAPMEPDEPVVLMVLAAPPVVAGAVVLV